jgi:hypothetical protein
VRDAPGGDVIGMADPGTVLYVLGGPICDDGFLFWRVQSEGGELEGWTAEIGSEGYWYLDAGSPYPP